LTGVKRVEKLVGVPITAGLLSLMRVTLGILAALLDRLGHHEPAATISGFRAEAVDAVAGVATNVR
jgi:hypothetical protein